MSIRVHLDRDSILYSAPVGIQGKKQAIALDGFVHTLDTLVEVSERLEGKLLHITNSHGLVGVNVGPRTTSSILADVWQMIEAFRRLLLFCNEAEIGLPSSISSQLENAKEFRDSYHHLEERIPEFFITNGLSVYGDLYWFNRTNIEDKEHFNLLTTGAIKGNNELYIDSYELNTKKFENKIGVYNLNVMYVAREFSHKDLKNKKVFTNNRKTFCIDEAAAKVNSLVALMEDEFVKIFTPMAAIKGVSDVKQLYTVIKSYFKHDVSSSNLSVRGKTKAEVRKEEEEAQRKQTE